MQPRRPAAVAIAIIASPPYGVIFVERATHLRDHPGQIGLPGGRVESHDGDDLERTVLRELHEEVGIDPHRVRIVGRLPMVVQRVNTFDVTPFVAVVAPGPLTIDGNETAGVFTIPLAVVLSEELAPGHVAVGERTVESFILEYEDRRVWGLTGGILRMFSQAWHDPSLPLRAAIEAELPLPP
jgi:8-oxo-dGTP pyrophosphatase MutT (NUDIX family)